MLSQSRTLVLRLLPPHNGLTLDFEWSTLSVSSCLAPYSSFISSHFSFLILISLSLPLPGFDYSPPL